MQRDGGRGDVPPPHGETLVSLAGVPRLTCHPSPQVRSPTCALCPAVARRTPTPQTASSTHAHTSSTSLTSAATRDVASATLIRPPSASMSRSMATTVAPRTRACPPLRAPTYSTPQWQLLPGWISRPHPLLPGHHWCPPRYPPHPHPPSCHPHSSREPMREQALVSVWGLLDSPLGDP